MTAATEPRRADPDVRELADMVGERLAEFFHWHTNGDRLTVALVLKIGDETATFTQPVDPALAVRLVAALVG
jgi:hypothetical protein